MKTILAIGMLAIGLLTVGCSGGDGAASGDNAAEVKKMANQPQTSNNPDVPAIDARNDEFGSSDGKKKLGG